MNSNKKENNEPLKKDSRSTVFSGNSNILPLSNFGVFGQESTPQSLTIATLNRFRKSKSEIFGSLIEQY